MVRDLLLSVSAPRVRAAAARLERFEEAGPPELPPRDQNVRMRLRGGRTGKRAVVCTGLELTGRSFERFLVFTPDGSVRESAEPVWD